MIYLDSPAGVGLSYSDTRSDYVTNDTATAADANTFLRGFFREYPEFLQNELYIAGVQGRPHPATVKEMIQISHPAHQHTYGFNKTKPSSLSVGTLCRGSGGCSARVCPALPHSGTL